MVDGSRSAEDRQAAEGAPHGITLFDHARITAEIAEADRPLAEVLRASGVSEAAWNESTMYWMKRLGDDVLAHGQDARLPELYSSAFSAAQDALKPVRPMTSAEYAELTVQIQTAGDTARPLAARGLSSADYLRLSRHFARLFSAEPVQARAFFEAFQALTAEP